MDRQDFNYKYENDFKFKEHIDNEYGKAAADLILALVDRRKELKMTTQDLAYNADMAIGSVSNIENFKQFPSHKSLRKIAKVLCVDIKFDITAIE